jgi:hypothetical protein
MGYKVFAKGTHGNYYPYLDRNGEYPLYSPELQRQSGKPIYHAANKYGGVTILVNAIRLVKEQGFYWRLKAEGNSQKNVFAPDSIVIKEF